MASKIQQIIEIITRGADKSEKQVKGVSGALGGLAKKASIAAAAYFGTSGLINAVQKSTQAFAQQELAEKKLRFAAGASTNELIKQAQALQQVTRFGDEALINQQAYVKSLGISTEQTKEIIAASVDLAAAMGISLESAVMNTTKTLSGMQGELGEKLPAAFKNLTAEQLKAGEGIEFIREQFRGTAEEEAQTFTGTMDQMANAVGDLQERIGQKLAPSLEKLAHNFKNLITINPSEEAIKEKNEFNALLNILKDVNSSTSSRELAIKELKSEYVDYLDDLNIEKASLEDIEKLQTNQVAVMEKRIRQMIQAEQLETVTEELERAKIHLFEEQKKLRNDGFDEFRKGTLMEITLMEGTIASLEEEKLRILENQEEYNNLSEIKKKDANKDIKNADTVGKFQQKIDAARIASKGKLNEEILKTFGIEKSEDLKEALRNAYAIGQDAYRWGTARGGPLLGAITGATGLSAGLAYAKNISAFATGADYITNGPEMIMVGDNPSGQERVQVTPLGGDPNINGPQGGMTINIQGSVIGTEQFTEDVLMPQIEEGLRLGNRI